MRRRFRLKVGLVAVGVVCIVSYVLYICSDARYRRNARLIAESYTSAILGYEENAELILFVGKGKNNLGDLVIVFVDKRGQRLLSRTVDVFQVDVRNTTTNKRCIAREQWLSLDNPSIVALWLEAVDGTEVTVVLSVLRKQAASDSPTIVVADGATTSVVEVKIRLGE